MTLNQAGGRILIQNDPKLSKAVQQALFDRGYRFIQTGQQFQTEPIHGICFFTYRGGVPSRTLKLMQWTQSELIFRTYPRPEYSLEQIRPGNLSLAKQRNPELIEMT